MKKMKRFVAMVLAGVMAAAMVFPSMAYTPKYGSNSTEIIQDGDVRWAAGKARTYPCWEWYNGYCYYMTGPDFNRDRLRDCVTPDGWTVDAEGRWTENGVPQSNGYGNFVIGTDELYAGKTDAERWNVMQGLLENLFANHIYGTESYLALRSSESLVMGNMIKEGFSTYSINYRPWVHSSPDKVAVSKDYICMSLDNLWNDCPDQYVQYYNEIVEKMIKIVCGDHVGQELFNDLRTAADGANGGSGTKLELDKNGQVIPVGDGKVKIKHIENASDGIVFSRFDLTKWNGRKTDYGKSIMIEYNEETNINNIGDWTLWIME